MYPPKTFSRWYNALAFILSVRVPRFFTPWMRPFGSVLQPFVFLQHGGRSGAHSVTRLPLPATAGLAALRHGTGCGLGLSSASPASQPGRRTALLLRRYHFRWRNDPLLRGAVGSRAQQVDSRVSYSPSRLSRPCCAHFCRLPPPWPLLLGCLGQRATPSFRLVCQSRHLSHSFFLTFQRSFLDEDVFVSNPFSFSFTFVSILFLVNFPLERPFSSCFCHAGVKSTRTQSFLLHRPVTFPYWITVSFSHVFSTQAVALLR